MLARRVLDYNHGPAMAAWPRIWLTGMTLALFSFSVTRTKTALVLVVLTVVLAVVLMTALRALHRDRKALTDHFSLERAHQLEQAVVEIRSDFEKIGDDLRLAGVLARSADSPSDLERELGAFVAVAREYRGVELHDATNEVQLRVSGADSKELELAYVREIIAQTSAHALADTEHRVRTSPPMVGEAGAWLRVFAAAVPRADNEPAAAIALVVDTRPFFSKLNIIAADSMTRLIVLGARNMPAPTTDPELARIITELDAHKAELRGFARLIDAMHARGHGELQLGADESARLGMGTADVIALFMPITIDGGDSWSIALLASVAAVRDHERTILWRMILIVTLIVLFLTGGAAYIIISARRAVALRERLRHADEVAHLREKAEKILDTIPTGVIALAQDGRISAVNRMLRDRIGDGAVGQTLAGTFRSAPGAELEQLSELLDSARAEDRVHSLFGVDLQIFATVGRYNIHAVPLEQRFPDARALLVIEDLSAVRDLESQLLRSEKLATVGILAAGIAHEIGTPLGVVRGRAEYTLSKLDPDSPHAAGQQVIVDQIDQVSRTIRQLLDFSRVKLATMRTVELAPVIRSVADLLRFEAERRKVTIAVVLPAAPLFVQADPDQLQQVLVNLIMNACDACPSDGHVTVTATPTSGAVRIEVGDDGCGIPEAHRNQVFDPFFTTKKRGQGTGLGLSVVSQIARNHDARIEVDSEVDRGTRMIIDWPAPSA